VEVVGGLHKLQIVEIIMKQITKRKKLRIKEGNAFINRELIEQKIKQKKNLNEKI